MPLPAPLLAIALAACAVFVRHDARPFARCKEIAETRARRPTFLRWTIKALAYFLGMPLVGLALLGRIDALWRFPAEFAPAARNEALPGANAALAEEACFRPHLPPLLVPP